ncbi:MAG: LON peptidase substrate-binding domain-containing protein [Pseudomonadota bacterium]
MAARIPLFPLSQGLLPDGMLHLNIFEVRYLDLIKRCQHEAIPFGVVGLVQGREVQVPDEVPQLHHVGTLAHLQEVDAVQPALLQVLCQGGLRFALTDHERGPFGVWYAQVRYLPADAPEAIPPDLQPLANMLGRLIADGQQTGSPQVLPIFAPYRLDECGWVANRWTELLPISGNAKQQLLAELNPVQRLQRIAGFVDL